MPSRILILGGGYFGSRVAASLDAVSEHFDLQLTMVDERDFLIHKLATLRSSVVNGWAEKAIVPHASLLKHGSIVNDVIEEVNSSEVKLASGDALTFDFCVLATGSMNRCPGEPSHEVTSKDDLLEFFHHNVETIKDSTKIAIIGGGVVGVELAGEIKAEYGDDKDVIIIHSGPKVINNVIPEYSEDFYEAVNEQLKDINVEVLLNTKAKIDFRNVDANSMIVGPQVIHTDSGREIEVDLCLVCAGLTPCSSAFPSTWLNERNFVNVDDHLRVVDSDKGPQENIYALGDVAALEENKMALYSADMAEVVVKNILDSIDGADKPQHTYALHNKAPMMVVPIGPSGGAVILPNGTFGPEKAVPMKARTLGVEKVWGLHKMEVPE